MLSTPFRRFAAARRFGDRRHKRWMLLGAARALLALVFMREVRLGAKSGIDIAPERAAAG